MPVGLVILGRQGSGKGTQAVRIADARGVVHISTGDMLRAAVAAGTPLGLAAKEIMDAGGLVSDDIMNGIVRERLAEPDVVAGGFLLDGYPRTPGQADALAEAVGDQLDLAINLDVPVAEVTARMMARGREDDTPESIRAPSRALRGRDRAVDRLVRGPGHPGGRRRHRHRGRGLRPPRGPDRDRRPMNAGLSTSSTAGGGIGVGAGSSLPLGSSVGSAPILGACPIGRSGRYGTSRILRCGGRANC